MKKVQAYVGTCPECRWEFLEPTQDKVKRTLALHLAAIHLFAPQELQDALDKT